MEANNLITAPPLGEATSALSHNAPWWPQGKGCGLIATRIFSCHMKHSPYLYCIFTLSSGLVFVRTLNTAV